MGKSHKRYMTKFKESAYLNNANYILYKDIITDIALSTFQWYGFPDSIDTLFFEKILTMRGSILVFEDPVMGLTSLPYLQNSQLDIYNHSYVRRAFASNGYRARLTKNESVEVWNNFYKRPTAPLIDYFAYRLWSIDRIIDVNANAQKTPILIRCTESQKLSMENAYMQYDGNQPVIFVDKNFNPDSGFGVFKTDAPFIADKMYELRKNIWRDIMTYIGVPSQEDKRERILADESRQNRGAQISIKDSRLIPRQKAAKDISKMFGMNVTVNFNPELELVDANELYDDTSEIHM